MGAAVKHWVHSLSKILVGDKKVEVTPLFSVVLTLEKNQRIELKPTVQELFDVLHSVSKKFQMVFLAVARLPRLHVPPPRITLSPALGAAEDAEAAGKPEPELPSFYQEVCGNAKHTQKAASHITDGVTGIVDKVQQLLVYWEKKYKAIWETEKDAFIRRYERANRPLEAYKSDIASYNNMAEEILLESSTETVKFLSLECSPLKEVLVISCQAWVSRLTALLASVTAKEAAALLEAVQAAANTLQQLPTPSMPLAEGLKVVETRRAEAPGFQSRMAGIQDKLAALTGYGFTMGQLEGKHINRLESLLNGFQATLEASQRRLEAAEAAEQPQASISMSEDTPTEATPEGSAVSAELTDDEMKQTQEGEPEAGSSDEVQIMADTEAAKVSDGGIQSLQSESQETEGDSISADPAGMGAGSSHDKDGLQSDEEIDR